MAKTYLILIVTFFLAQTLNSTEIYGVPKIIDGDSVHINNKKIRLEGIDAPEIKQQCNKPFLQISTLIGFQFSKSYSCGVTSKKKLNRNNKRKHPENRRMKQHKVAGSSRDISILKFLPDYKIIFSNF